MERLVGANEPCARLRRKVVRLPIHDLGLDLEQAVAPPEGSHVDLSKMHFLSHDHNRM